MSDVSKMKNASTGEVQDIKDATAREQISELNETLTELTSAVKINATSLLDDLRISTNDSYYLNGVVYLNIRFTKDDAWNVSEITNLDVAQIDSKYAPSNTICLSMAYSLNSSTSLISVFLQTSGTIRVRVAANSSSAQPFYVSGSYYIGDID